MGAAAELERGLILARMRRGRKRKETGDAETWPPDHFLAVCGLLTSAFFIFVIVVQAIPTFVLRACD